LCRQRPSRLPTVPVSQTARSRLSQRLVAAHIAARARRALAACFLCAPRPRAVCSHFCAPLDASAGLTRALAALCDCSCLCQTRYQPTSSPPACALALLLPATSAPSHPNHSERTLPPILAVLTFATSTASPIANVAGRSSCEARHNPGNCSGQPPFPATLASVKSRVPSTISTTVISSPSSAEHLRH
jgi:hypothetical protein